MKSKKRILLAAIVIVVVAVVALPAVRPPLAPEEPLPSPNGYDFFVKGAAMLSDKTGDWNTLSIDELRELVATNATGLETIRAGLPHESRIPPYSLVAGDADHIAELANLKNSACAFCALHRLTLHEARTNDAARIALDCVRFGHESSRGGVVIDGLVGLAIEAIGRKRLDEALPGTDSVTAREIASTLEQLSERRELVSAFLKREADWTRRGRFGTSYFFTQLLQPIVQRKMRIRTEQKFQQAAADLHRTTLRAAAHAYELDQGRPPVSARDLVPNYLKSVPLDPVTGREMPLN